MPICTGENPQTPRQQKTCLHLRKRRAEAMKATIQHAAALRETARQLRFKTMAELVSWGLEPPTALDPLRRSPSCCQEGEAATPGGPAAFRAVRYRLASLAANSAAMAYGSAPAPSIVLHKGHRNTAPFNGLLPSFIGNGSALISAINFSHFGHLAMTVIVSCPAFHWFFNHGSLLPVRAKGCRKPKPITAGDDHSTLEACNDDRNTKTLTPHRVARVQSMQHVHGSRPSPCR